MFSREKGSGNQYHEKIVSTTISPEHVHVIEKRLAMVFTFENLQSVVGSAPYHQMPKHSNHFGTCKRQSPVAILV